MPERFIRPVLAIIAASMILWIFFWLAFTTSKKGKSVKISLKAETIIFLFYVYIVGVLSLTVFPLPFERFKTASEDGINLVPIIHIVQGFIEIFYKKETLSEHSFQNIFGNVVLFIPFGIFMPLMLNKYRSPGKLTLLACICSASIELTQLVLRQFEIYRTVDIDDVILNTCGAMLGFAIIKKILF